MNRLLSSLAEATLSLAALAMAAPTLVGLIHSLIPLIVLGCVIAVMLRLVWSVTRRW